MRLHPEPDTFACIVNAFLEDRYKNKFQTIERKKYSLLFSDEAVFYLGPKGLSMVSFIDSYEDMSLYKTDKTHLLVDKSFCKYVPFRQGKLPLDIIEKNYERFRFKTTTKSPVSLHIAKEDSGLVTEAWFEVPDNMINNPSIKEDLDTFLAC
jgi:hypothetical protein